MINKDNYKKILSAYIDKYGEIPRAEKIVFDVDGVSLEYRSEGYYLKNLHGSNDEIFTMLNLDKNQFFESVLHYCSRGGDFLEVECNEHLIPLTRALFEACDVNSIKPISLKEISKNSFLGKLKKSSVDERYPFKSYYNYNDFVQNIVVNAPALDIAADEQ